MPINSDQLMAVFQHLVLTKIVGYPNLAIITLKQSKHNGNLDSIKSNVGDVLTGLMVISMKPEIFKTIHPNTFAITTNPGPAPDPVAIAAASADTKITDLYKAYALESEIYSKFVSAERISMKLALDSMAELYYKTLKTRTRDTRTSPYGSYLTTWSQPTPPSTSLTWKRTRKK